MNPGFGGPGLLGTPQNMSPSMMGGPGGNQRGSGRIPSLLDINTKKPQGKRGFTGPRDQGGFKKQRLTPQKVFFFHIYNLVQTINYCVVYPLINFLKQWCF